MEKFYRGAGAPAMFLSEENQIGLRQKNMF
jgi:hypothetical protein